ncbi:hypothetical protein DY000_02018958 [Brassica cretica]|nr:hypothetical protein DY000_02018958 [Brassica cretica]
MKLKVTKDAPGESKTHVSTRVMGTYGYAAPEPKMSDVVEALKPIPHLKDMASSSYYFQTMQAERLKNGSGRQPQPVFGHCLVLMDLREETGLDQERVNHNLCFGHCLVLMVNMVPRLIDIRFLLQNLQGANYIAVPCVDNKQKA